MGDQGYYSNLFTNFPPVNSQIFLYVSYLAYGLPDGKRLPRPMATCSTNGVISTYIINYFTRHWKEKQKIINNESDISSIMSRQRTFEKLTEFPRESRYDTSYSYVEWLMVNPCFSLQRKWSLMCFFNGDSWETSSQLSQNEWDFYYSVLLITKTL